MAENKKSFVLYADYIHTFSELTDEEAGKLIKHVFAYVNDQNPQTEDKLLKIAFEPIKQQLKRDLKHWESIKEKRSRAGKASAEARQQVATGSTHVDTSGLAATLSTVNDNDNVNVNDTVTVTSKERERGALDKPSLEGSNLFRKPKIPMVDDVVRVFAQQGGTREMALAFYEKHSATAWYVNNSPIINFASMVPSYIRNWHKNEKNAKNKRLTADTSKPGSEITSI